ncbi:mitochondrial glycoprotein [Nemania sp. FL0916]|nr:mitochondrial glycoprotein [Nemania sp. FL0916]
MMSLRAIARSAPRSVARLSSTTIRNTRVAQPSSALRTAWAPLRTQSLAATFSSTARTRAADNEGDKELLDKLDGELQFEETLKKDLEQPASVKDFLENSPFELKDEPGKQDVYLTRKFGNESITVSFSIADLNSQVEDDMFNEEGLSEEEMETPEGKELAESEAAEDVEPEGPTQPMMCRLNVVVEKPNAGALNIECTASEGSIVIENFWYYKDGKLAHSASADAVHGAGDVYPGPSFTTLDEDLQLMLERFIEDRGITHAMALFVPDYMDVKEQREYHGWLKNVRNFVEA